MDKISLFKQVHLALYWSNTDASGSGNNEGETEGAGLPSLVQRTLSTNEYKSAKIDEIQPDEIDEVIQVFKQRLVAPVGQSDKRLKLNYFYKIKLVESLNRPEIFGRLTYFHPKDTDIEKVNILNLLVPKLKGPPVKVMLKGDWVDDKGNIESSRLRVPFYLCETEENKKIVKEANTLRENGFEPVLYDQADPTQTQKSSVSWINIINGSWIGNIKDNEKRRKTLDYFKTLMESDNHIVINYRSSRTDFDMNRHFNIVPVQWAKHSFLDAFERSHIENIVINGYNNILQNIEVNKLKE